MTFSPLIPLAAGGVNLAVTWLVLSRNLRARLNWVYLLWGLSLSVWNLGVYFIFQADTPERALVWARALQLGVIFLPISGFHLCLLVAQARVPLSLLCGLYAVHFALAVLDLFTPWFVASVRAAGYAYYSVAGPAYWAFAVLFGALACAGVVVLHRREQTVGPLHRRRLRVLRWAMLMLILFGANDILPILGVFVYPLTPFKVYPWGSAAAIAYGMLVGYSALQHELLDVRIALSRAAAQGVRILFLGLTGLVLLLLVGFWLPGGPSQLSLGWALAVVLASALIASVWFPRLFSRGEAALERWILSDQFEYRDRVRGFIQSIPLYTDTDLLLRDLHNLVVGIIRAQRYQIILLERPTRAFVLYRAHPPEPIRHLPDLRPDSPLFELFQRTDAKCLAFNIGYALPDETDLERAARQQLREFSPEFCFPFFAEGEPFGLLLIGEKSDHRLYTSHDQELLIELVNNLGLVINEIRLKNEVLVAEELALLGRLSRGMAHDLNNLITPLRTYFQLAQAEALTTEARETLLPHALRSIEVIQSYIKEALFVAEQDTPQFRSCEVSRLVREAAALHAPTAGAKNIDLVVKTIGELEAEVEPTLLQRLLANLLANAVDASRPGGRVQVTLFPLPTQDGRNGWMQLSVRDQGEGMSTEVLRQAGRPYFTTKDHGDVARGFGLGLTICRKIVHLHQGDLSIRSQPGEGTTVQVNLPLHHPAATG